MFVKHIASREKVKLMIGLMGPSGSGKTYSALQLAYGITKDWSKIAVADTENRSSLYYAGDKTGPWSHIDFPPTMKDGYHPSNWVALIDFVEKDPKIEVLILDSISHEWEAKGGSLDLNNKLGGRFTDWAKVTPLHAAFIDKMRSSRLHIIATMRSKSDYAIELNEKGKPQPTKVGLKAIQRDGTEYEFGVIFDIDMRHFASTCKDRTGLFMRDDRGPFRISADTGKELLSWANEHYVDPESLKGISIEFFDKIVEGANSTGIDFDVLNSRFKAQKNKNISEAINSEQEEIRKLFSELRNEKKQKDELNEQPRQQQPISDEQQQPSFI